MPQSGNLTLGGFEIAVWSSPSAFWRETNCLADFENQREWQTRQYRVSKANEVRDPTSETVIAIIQALEEINPDAMSEFKRLYMGDSEL